MRRLGLLALVGILTCAAGAAGQSKKAYELIYEDVQLLKQQLLKLEDRIGAAAAEIQSLSSQVRDLQSQLRLLQTDQAGLKQGLQNIPSQYQVVLTRLESLSLQLTKLTEEIIAARTAAMPPGGETAPEAGSKPKAEDKARGKDKKPAKPEEAKAAASRETAGPAAPSNQTPKEIYDMAYADYIRGNYSLAIDGFKIYREQFPDSPLADNALYWIGECFFSQRKFEEAIEQFNLLLFDYPQGDKTAAAYLKKGFCFLELGKKEEALSVFKLLIAKYPNEEETRLAQQKIKEILGQNEGHQQS
ncbi:MAG: tol-pal system protein YbgF [Candidatus Aminicenantales bacterium]